MIKPNLKTLIILGTLADRASLSQELSKFLSPFLKAKEAKKQSVALTHLRVKSYGLCGFYYGLLNGNLDLRRKTFLENF
ncbi:hypothetical protein ACFE35_11045 [Phormidesmis priestleyi ANT.L61.2]